MTPTPSRVAFTPTAVEGGASAAGCVVTPDRLELVKDSGPSVVIPCETIARYGRPVALQRLLHRSKLRRRWVPVGERDWCQPEGQQFFRFFTDPPLVLTLPEDRHLGYGDTLFARITAVLAEGGFSTYDLG
jgi:hypothetical protein